MKWDDIISRVGGSTTESEISAFELEIGCALPADYRSFLQVFNGGFINFEHVVEVDIDGETEETEIISFFPLKGAEVQLASGVSDTWARWKKTGDLIEHCLAVGDDGGTGFFFLIIKGKLKGKFFYSYSDDYFYSAENFKKGVDTVPECFGLVANSFDGLLSSIKAID